MPRNWNEWSKGEVEFLKKNSDSLSSKELAAKLKRTVYSINNKRRKLGLRAKEDTKSKALRNAMLGDKNPNWKGDAAPKTRGNERARSWYKESIPCQKCGNQKAERHHKDGNPLNNHPVNIIFLCRRHHMEADGRLSRLIQRNLKGASSK